MPVASPKLTFSITQSGPHQPQRISSSVDSIASKTCPRLITSHIGNDREDNSSGSEEPISDGEDDEFAMKEKKADFERSSGIQDNDLEEDSDIETDEVDPEDVETSLVDSSNTDCLPATPRGGSAAHCIKEQITPQSRGTSSQHQENTHQSTCEQRRPFIEEDYRTARVYMSFKDFSKYIFSFEDDDRFPDFLKDIKNTSQYKEQKRAYKRAYRKAKQSKENDKERGLYEYYAKLSNCISERAYDVLGTNIDSRTILYVQKRSMYPPTRNDLKPNLGEVFGNIWQEISEMEKPKVAWAQLVGFHEFKLKEKYLDKGVGAKILLDDEGKDPRGWPLVSETIFVPAAGNSQKRKTDASGTSGSNAKRQKVESASNQMANYALALLSQTPLRTHVIGALVCGEKIQYMYYDHSAIVIAHPIDFLKDEDLFIKSIFASARLTLSQRGIPSWFPDPYVRNYRKYFGGGEAYKHPENILEGITISDKDRNMEIELGRTIYRQSCIIGRATIVTAANWVNCPHGNSRLVVKISHPFKARASEIDIIGKIVKKVRSTGKKWVLKHIPTIYSSEDFKHPVGSPAYNLARAFRYDNTALKWNGGRFSYEERVIRCVVQRRLYPITKLEELRETGQVFFDILQVNNWVNKEAEVMHRDMSRNNFMCRIVMKNGSRVVYGVLNDWDLSSFLEDLGRASSFQRTGTRIYMAFELFGIVPTRPLFRHDMESFIYIMMDVGGASAEAVEFDKWPSMNSASLRNNKEIFLEKNTPFKVENSYHDLAVWIEELRTIMSQGLIQRDIISMKAKLGTLTDADTFDDQTLGGFVTHEAFYAVMKKLGCWEFIDRDPKAEEDAISTKPGGDALEAPSLLPACT